MGMRLNSQNVRTSINELQGSLSAGLVLYLRNERFLYTGLVLAQLHKARAAMEINRYLVFCTLFLFPFSVAG